MQTIRHTDQYILKRARHRFALNRFRDWCGACTAVSSWASGLDIYQPWSACAPHKLSTKNTGSSLYFVPSFSASHLTSAVSINHGPEVVHVSGLNFACILTCNGNGQETLSRDLFFKPQPVWPRSNFVNSSHLLRYGKISTKSIGSDICLYQDI